MQELGVSIIICCHNSALKLPETIGHIAQQKVVDSLNWELVIINNNSNDDTKTIASDTIDQYPELIAKTRIIDEPNPGLSFARHTGVSNAKYEFVIFCDDDNWLAPDYVDTAFNLMSQNSDLGAIGGASTPISNGILPDDFVSYQKIFAVGKQYTLNGILPYTQYLWGAGLVLKREAYLAAYNPTPSLLADRTGNVLNSGGDTELCCRLLLMGYKLAFFEQLKFKHFVEISRLDPKYLARLYKGFDQANEIIFKYQDALSIKFYPKNKPQLILKLLCQILTSKFVYKDNWKLNQAKRRFYFLTRRKFKIDNGTIAIQTFIDSIKNPIHAST